MSTSSTRTPAAAEGSVTPEELLAHLAYGQAALMLLDSLLLLMIERHLFSKDELSQAIENAVETKKGFIDGGLHPQVSTVAAAALTQLANSLAASRPRPSQETS